MAPTTYETSALIGAPISSVFSWHERPGAFERLAPPWERVEVMAREGTIHDGDRTVLRMHLGPLRRRWVAVHRDFVDGRRFRDDQVEGPFARWTHTHDFVPAGSAGCTVADRIEYALPLGPLGAAVAGHRVRRTLDRMFRWRHAVLAADLARHRAVGERRLRIAISGSSGLIGSALASFLSTGGHDVVRLVRRPAGRGELRWDAATGAVDGKALEGIDAVVHLAGESIAGRWSARKREAIRASRERGTRALAEALARLDRPPEVLVAASAIGLYGDRGDEPVDERSEAGDNFLSEVCRGWESSADPARSMGIRVVNARFGVVLSPRGGALARMLPPFRFGLGGPVGGGQQVMSWIALDDAVGAIHHAIFHRRLEGPMNVVAPEAETSRAFAATLGRVLRRPARLPLPRFVVRALFGELGQSLLLDGVRVVPRALLETGFTFRQPSLEGALREMLGRP